MRGGKNRMTRGGNRYQRRKHVLRASSENELARLERQVQELAPPRGTNPLHFDGRENESANDIENEKTRVYYSASKRFDELPITEKTKQGLAEAGFVEMTSIQRASIPHALAGRDILGAAQTGQGKTLAFVVPALELLARKRFTAADGVGVLIISPTRELAMQIFEVLRKVGSRHNMSAGLVIGGKNVDTEQDMIAQMNIVVATPGRILHHFDQTPGFTCDNLLLLVLDETDLCMSMGFKKTLNAIIEALPKNARQTLLFSATQTKNVSDLVRLSLRDPEYVSVHAVSTTATPKKLAQTCMVVTAHDKLDVLWSFFKTHLHSKCIVFISSVKQVRFMFEMYRRLHPGIPLLHLHGKMSQSQRMAIYYTFIEQYVHFCIFDYFLILCNNSNAAVLLTTDLAARGLDISGVSWVVQFDAPESVDAYIHRVGRTARFKDEGHGLLFLLPSEVAFIEQLTKRKIPIKTVQVNPQRMRLITPRFASFLAEDADLKYLGQKAFVSYLRSVYLQANKDVFDVHKIDAGKLATAMGLPIMPKIKFKNVTTSKTKKNLSRQNQELDEEVSLAKGHVERLIDRKNSSVLHESRLRLCDDEDEDEEEFLEVKRAADDTFEVELQDSDLQSMDQRHIRRFDFALGKRKLRDELEEETRIIDVKGKSSAFSGAVRAYLKGEDPTDKAADRVRVRELHKKKRLVERHMRLRTEGKAVAQIHSESDADERDIGDASLIDDDSDVSECSQSSSEYGSRIKSDNVEKEAPLDDEATALAVLSKHAIPL